MKEIAIIINMRMKYQILHLIKVLTQNYNKKVKIINRFKWEKYNFKNCSIAITTDPVEPEMIAAINSAKEAGVPTLTIQDGIIEYEHSWKKRLDRYRPLLTDRIAVFGNFTKNILVSWGIPEDKIDVVGCPRFDVYNDFIKTYPLIPRILLTSANTPYVDEKTKEQFRVSFLTIAKELENSGVDYFIRLNKRKAIMLFAKEPIVMKKLRYNQCSIVNRVLNRLSLSQQPAIAQDICSASAVITTPSTVVLEAMALERPVALINYNCETIYHRTPWEIGSSNNIKAIVQELLNPPPAKMLFQNQLFADYVYYDGSASKRIVDIIEKMVKIN